MPIGLHAGLNLAQWSVGQRGMPGGIWTAIADPAANARIATLSPILVVGMAVLVTLVLWRGARRAGAR